SNAPNAFSTFAMSDEEVPSLNLINTTWRKNFLFISNNGLVSSFVFTLLPESRPELQDVNKTTSSKAVKMLFIVLRNFSPKLVKKKFQTPFRRNKMNLVIFHAETSLILRKN